MAKISVFDCIGKFLAIVGSVVLVVAFLPVINPTLLGKEHYRDGMTAHNYCGVVVAIIVLNASWYFNKKAQRLKKKVQLKDGVDTKMDTKRVKKGIVE